MGHYRCSSCGCSMEFETESANQTVYTCPKCGKKGKITGMKESTAPVDPGAFGL